MCLDVLPNSHPSARFTMLCIVNRITDICIWHEAHELQTNADDENEAKELASSGTKFLETGSTDIHGNVPPCKKLHLLPHQESLERATYVNLDRVAQVSLRSDQDSPRHRLGSRKSKPASFRHRESQRSLISSSVVTQDETSQEAVPTEAEPNSSFHDLQDNNGGTALDVLMNSDPALFLAILQDSIAKYKQVMAARHRCTPSIRWRHCTHHCLQILSARLFTVMCQGTSVQHKVISCEHLKALVDALDPNNDPVSIRVDYINCCDCLV